MRFSFYSVAIAGFLAATAVQAQEAAPAAPAAAPAAAASVELKSGLSVRSADGRRVGRVDRVVSGKDGAASSVAVIFDSRFVYIPASTLSRDDKGLVTSLSRAEVAKLR